MNTQTLDIQNEEQAQAPQAESLHPSMLPKVLRYIGATTLGLSALTFAVGQVREMNALGRFYSFFGFTGVIALCGILCALKLKEDKGARTFLGMSLVFIPALFLQLGALTYYICFGTPPHLPALFVMTAPSVSHVTLAFITTIPVIALIAFGAFSAFVRPKAALLTIGYFALNAILLVPTRVPDDIALLLLAGGAIATAIFHQRRNQDRILHTFEGGISLATLVLPLVLLVGRSVSLYGGSVFLSSMVFGVAGALIWKIDNREGRLGACSNLQGTSIVSLMFSWMLFVSAIVTDSSSMLFVRSLANVHESVLLPFLFLPMAAALSLIAPRLGTSARTATKLAAMLGCYPLIYQLLTVESSFLSAYYLVLGTAVITGAFLIRDRGILRTGSLLVATAVGVNLHYALELYRMNPWLTLGIAGGAIVLASSYLEHNLGKLIAKVGTARGALSAWQ